MGPSCVESCITHSHYHPCDCQIRKFKREDKTKKKKREAPRALPKNHNVAVPNLFGCTTPRLGVLTGNAPDANLSPRPASARIGQNLHVRVLGRYEGNRTYDRETGAPDQDERKGQYEPYFCGNVFLQ